MAVITPGTWNLDGMHSHVNFSVRHAGISKVRGEFTDVSGKLTSTEGADPVVEASVEIDSIDTGVADRDGHLKSADFFDSENFGQMTFKSTSFKVDGEDLTMEGELTIKGETRPVTFTGEFGGETKDQYGNNRLGASVSTKISRKDFGITWSATLESGNVLVGDAVTINLDAEFVAA